jgi:hypothetical protein
LVILLGEQMLAEEVRASLFPTAWAASKRYSLLMKALTTLLAFASLVSTSIAGGLYDIPLKDINGQDTSLKAYEGKVLLIVNVASKCGNTPQYSQLQALHEQFASEGLAVLGFPCNDFGKQEPGSNQEIQEFCSTKYKVTFPLFDKVVVKGPEKHWPVSSPRLSPMTTRSSRPSEKLW